MTHIVHNQAIFAHASLALRAGHGLARDPPDLRLGPSGQALHPATTSRLLTTRRS